MDGENPTTGDSGASITDRLERMLSADVPEAKSEPTQAEPVETQTDNSEGADEGVEQQASEPLKVSTAELAELLDIDESLLDVDENGKLKIKTKIDGSESAAKLRDLLKDHQIQGHAENKARQAAEREKAVQARQAEIERIAQERMGQVEQMANVAAAELLRDYQSINWEAIRQTDPGQYAALKADFAERNQKLQGVFHQTAQERARVEQQMQAKRMQVLQEQDAKLPQFIPEWKDQTTRAKETGEIRDWAVKQGFDPAEFDNFHMAHHVVVMRKAMLYDKLQAKKPELENKVRTAPKLVKPGQAQSTGPEQQLRNLKTQVKASGGKRGIAEYLIASGKV